MFQPQRLLEIASEGPCFIHTHRAPDPDAIASAFGLQQFLAAHKIYAHIRCFGEIEKVNTVNMIHRLGIQITQIDDNVGVLSGQIQKSDRIFLVDAQKGNANLTNLKQKIVVCIDHHQTFVPTTYLYDDIRPEIGSCASMITQYFTQTQTPITPHIASALLYGIKMDTDNLMRKTSKLDLDMFYLLYQLANIELVRKIHQTQYRFEDLAAYAEAIRTIRIYDQVAFANIMFNCPEGLLGALSDFILSIDEIEIVIIHCKKPTGIKFSIRNVSKSINAGILVHNTLQKLGGDGGGHTEMAGGTISYQSIPKTPFDPTHELFNLEIESIFLGEIKAMEANASIISASI